MTNETTTPTESIDQGKRAPQGKSKKRPTAASSALGKQAPRETKTETALKALRRKRGASIAELQEMTGWQAHSVRGFLSGAVKKKLGLHVASEVGKDGVRRYRIDDVIHAASPGQEA